jgi:hypothetical protein
MKTDVSQPPSGLIDAIYLADTTGLLSLLLGIVRTSGSGGAQMFGGVDLVVSTAGIKDPGNTGIAL